MIEKITPTSKEHWLSERAKDITSTETAALFNVSPYMSEYELWHNKKNNTVVILDENERMKWGNALEEAIASAVCKDNDWSGEPLKDYWRLPDLKMGASFDWVIGTEDGIGLLEIKNVDGLVFRDSWEDDEGPAHIELQVQHQLAVSGCEYAYLAALVGGNTLKLYKRPRNEAVIDAIVKRIGEFWESIEKNRPPEIDYERDAAFITSLYSVSNPDTIMNLNENGDIYQLAKEYKAVSADITALEKTKKGIKAQILTKIGTFEKVKHENFSISAGMTKGSTSVVERKPFRNFRVTWKKEK